MRRRHPTRPLAPTCPHLLLFTLRFFHQYLRLSLAALVSNWEAPAWRASARSSSSESFWSRSRTLSTFTLMMSTTWGRGPRGRGVCQGTPQGGHFLNMSPLWHTWNMHPDVSRLICQGHTQNMPSIPGDMQGAHIRGMLLPQCSDVSATPSIYRAWISLSPEHTCPSWHIPG